MTQTITEKPTAAFVLSLIGGIIILLVGIAVIAAGSVFGSIIGGTSGVSCSPSCGAVIAAIQLAGSVGSVFGVLTIVFAVLLYMKPEKHALFGALVIVFSVLSFYGTVGGIVIGFILGLIGGILAITWHPKMTYQSMPPPPPMSGGYSSSQQSGSKTCPSCGASVPAGAVFCASCGKAV